VGGMGSRSGVVSRCVRRSRLNMRPASAQDPAGDGSSRCGLRTPSPGCDLLLILLHDEVATSPKICGLLRGCRVAAATEATQPPARIRGCGGRRRRDFFFICGSGGVAAWGRRRTFVFFHENDCRACDMAHGKATVYTYVCPVLLVTFFLAL
jgi:hypothetical protein